MGVSGKKKRKGTPSLVRLLPPEGEGNIKARRKGKGGEKGERKE